MAVDRGCERIHRERKRQTAKLYSLSKRGKRPGVGNYAGPEGLGFEILLNYKGCGSAVVWLLGC